MFYGPPVIIIAICIRNETLLKVSSLSRAAIISWCTTNVCVHVCVCYVPETLTIRQTTQISSAAAHGGLQLSAWRDRFKQNKNARAAVFSFFSAPAVDNSASPECQRSEYIFAFSHGHFQGPFARARGSKFNQSRSARPPSRTSMPSCVHVYVLLRVYEYVCARVRSVVSQPLSPRNIN